MRKELVEEEGPLELVATPEATHCAGCGI